MKCYYIKKRFTYSYSRQWNCLWTGTSYATIGRMCLSTVWTVYSIPCFLYNLSWVVPESRCIYVNSRICRRTKTHYFRHNFLQCFYLCWLFTWSAIGMTVFFVLYTEIILSNCVWCKYRESSNSVNKILNLSMQITKIHYKYD